MKTAKPKRNVRQKLKEFFKETFRTRDKSDYKEFFTRGLSGREVRAKVEYAWMYVRIFAISFTLFSLLAFLIAFSSNGIGVPTLYLLGGVFMNLTVAVFIYELNPERNLPLVLFILIMILGTAAADFIAIMGYYFYYPEDAWLAPLWTAFLEEAAKAIPAIVAILILKKRSPMLGFIIGAAIGAGFSITEDMGYIYAYSYGVYGMVEISLERAWTAVCTHTLWTAVIGWAFCKFKCRPYDWRFLLVALSSMAMHFVWDAPFGFYLHILPTILCIVAAIVFSVIVVKKERKPYKDMTGEREVQLVIPIPEDRSLAQQNYGKWCSGAANFVAAVTAVLVGVLFIVWCFAPVEYVSVDKRFKSEEEFLAFVQGDKVFLTNWDKELDDCLEVGEINYAIIIDGEYSYAFISVEEEDGYRYDYTFDFYEDLETGERYGGVTGIAVYVSDTEYYRLHQLVIPDEVTPEGITYKKVTYALVNDVIYCYYDEDSKDYVAVLDWYFDHTAEIVVSVFAVGVLLIGAVTFTVLKIKSKKLRRKVNVG